MLDNKYCSALNGLLLSIRYHEIESSVLEVTVKVANSWQLPSVI